METKKCAVCGKEMKFVPHGVSKKTGRPYEEFWSCPDRCKQPTKAQLGEQMIFDELKAINERLDKLGIFLKSKFQ